MISTSDHRIVSRAAGAGLMIMIALVSTAHGQQGFGPDPFQPYTSQYNPYVYPTGPASPEAGQSGARLGRSSFRGANQFQDYLNEMTGDRGGSNLGMGVPYYRSSVDPAFDTKNRTYRPNEKADVSFERAQTLVTQKYSAYLSERDPKKRAEFLKEYQRSQRLLSRSLTARRDTSPSRLLDSLTRREEAGRDAAGDGAEGRPPGTGRAGSTRSTSGGIGGPPPISSVRRPQRSTSRRDPVPSDVLDRARRLELGDEGSAADTPRPRSERPLQRRRSAAPAVGGVDND